MGTWNSCFRYRGIDKTACCPLEQSQLEAPQAGASAATAIGCEAQTLCAAANPLCVQAYPRERASDHTTVVRANRPLPLPPLSHLDVLMLSYPSGERARTPPTCGPRNTRRNHSAFVTGLCIPRGVSLNGQMARGIHRSFVTSPSHAII